MQTKKRGFSVVEAVVAMSIVAIVSFAAINLSLASTDTIAYNVHIFSAVSDVASMVEGFEFSDTEEQFLRTLSFMDAKYESLGNNHYKVTRDMYYIDLYVNYSVSRFEATAYLKTNDKKLYSYTYVG